MACKVIFTAGAKGGSGKTTAACFVVAYVQQHGVTPLIMDLDDESKSLSRFYPEALQVNIHQEFAPDVLIEKATSGQHARVRQEWETVQSAESILQHSGAKIVHDQNDSAFYNRVTDSIHLPPKSALPDSRRLLWHRAA